MSGFTLPRDNNSGTLQALCPVESSTQVVSNAGQTRVALTPLTSILRISATGNCYVKFGDNTVSATSSDLLFPSGAEVFSVKGANYTHISILGADASPCIVSVTRMI